jgi:hypothetical protein
MLCEIIPVTIQRNLGIRDYLLVSDKINVALALKLEYTGNCSTKTSITPVKNPNLLIVQKMV